MLMEVNVENIQVDERCMLVEVNVERCESVNICYFTACFPMNGYGDYCGVCRIIVGFVFENIFEETLGVISNTWILICR